MRLWHVWLLSRLPSRQLLGQHRECCALRGLGWGRKHATVDYVFRYSPYRLYVYHVQVMQEMLWRGYCCNSVWQDAYYRGKRCDCWTKLEIEMAGYPEHDEKYLEECVEILRNKGIDILPDK